MQISSITIPKKGLPLSYSRGNPNIRTVEYNGEDIVSFTIQYLSYKQILKNPKIAQIETKGYKIITGFWINGWYYLIVEPEQLLHSDLIVSWIWQIDQRYIDRPDQWEKLLVRYSSQYPHHQFAYSIDLIATYDGLEDILLGWEREFQGQVLPCVQGRHHIQRELNNKCDKCGKANQPITLCDDCALPIFRELYGGFLLRCYRWSYRQGAMRMIAPILWARKYKVSSKDIMFDYLVRMAPGPIFKAILLEVLRC